MDDHLNNLYDADFYRWVHRQAELLQARDFARLDMPNLIEEIESMGQSKRNALEKRMAVLLTHLLKYQMQPELISSSWIGTIVEQRKRIHKLLKKTPSLRRKLDECIAETYDDARDRAAFQTDLPLSTFPAVATPSASPVTGGAKCTTIAAGFKSWSLACPAWRHCSTTTSPTPTPSSPTT